MAETWIEAATGRGGLLWFIGPAGAGVDRRPGINRGAGMVDVVLVARHATSTGLGRSAHGFTVAELLIVVAVVAIAAALVVPRLGADDETRLRAAARVLVADIEYAQIDSITHSGAPRVVVFDTVAHAYRIALASTPATPITNPIDKQPYRVTFGSGKAATFGNVRIASVSLGGGSQIAFGDFGQTTQSTTNSTITLASGARSISISVDAETGEVSVGALN